MLEHNVTRSYYVELKFTVTETEVDAALDLEVTVDRLMDALEDVDGLTDVDLAANLQESTIAFCVSLTGSSQTEAHRAAVLAVRTAIHATGGHTPGWERAFNQLFEDEQYQSTVYSPVPVAV